MKNLIPIYIWETFLPKITKTILKSLIKLKYIKII